MEKDYYKILGLTEEDKRLPQDEFEKKLKKIFREKSKEHHPDRYSNAGEAERKAHEEIFKNISEAYNVLSDPKKRQEYDMGGSPFSGFGGFNPFSSGFNPFGAGFGFDEGPSVYRGNTIKIKVNITLEDVLKGTTKTVTYKKKKNCTKCHRVTCPHCHGTGVIENVTRNGFSTYIQRTACMHCGGTGYVTSGHCDNCGGKGYTVESVTETIKVPKGVESGMQMGIEGKGHDFIGAQNGIPGDLYVIFEVQEHDRFTRYGNSLSCDLELTLEEAFCGCETEIETLSGSKLKISIPPLTPSGKQFRLNGKGLPVLNNDSVYGPLICVVDYKVPKKPLTKRQKELLKEFYQIEKEKGA